MADGSPTFGILRNVLLFDSLADLDLKRIARESRHVTFKAGELIFRQGHYGHNMYVIEAGSVQVLANGHDGADVVVARLERGHWFGEQALLPGGTSRRNAAVRAYDDVTLLEVSRENFLIVLEKDPKRLEELRQRGRAQQEQQKLAIQEAFLQSLSIEFAEGSHRKETFAAGETVFHEGDIGDRVYMVQSGRAIVSQRNAGGESILSELEPGQFFGELALVRHEPRSATVRAETDLELISLDGGWFLQLYETNPSLRALMESLRSIYVLPRRGVVTQQSGRLDGEPSLTTLYHLPNGRQVIGTRMIGRPVFAASLLGAQAQAEETVRFQQAEGHQRREFSLKQGRIVGLYSEGEWLGLGRMFERLLDGEEIQPWQALLFKQCGDFELEDTLPLYEDREVVCGCTQVTRGALRQAIAAGCHTREALATKTGASLVCGGCGPLIAEMLGRPDFLPAKVIETAPVSATVRSFRIQPVTGTCKSYRAGQHILLQAQIDNRWIQRSYTLSSAPGAGHYEITVKREPNGVFSQWLFDRCLPNAVLRVSEPAGNYFLPDDQENDIVCLVSGIGVTPALAITRTLAQSPREFRLHVDYSMHDREASVYTDELLSYARQHENIEIRLRITGEEGRVQQEDIDRLHQMLPKADFYLCGGASYLKSVTDYLRASGVREDRIHIEVFTPAGATPIIKRQRDQSSSGDHNAILDSKIPQTWQEEAQQFLQRFYLETGVPEAFDLRWKQVTREIENSGTYVHSHDELVFAARFAWRNVGRCVGREYWHSLSVRDFRNIMRVEEIFEALFAHIELSTNGGDIRPVMTVFPPGKEGGCVRIWNHQLLQYAGYRLPEGGFLGDPGNAELTEVALRLGWEPPTPRTRFDILPLIVQMPGLQAQWAEIPRSLVTEVPIHHPGLPWFEELGLKWFALPSVCNLALDAGGVVYRAAPFSRWYTSPEIGARYLGASDRYNVLPEIARRMGLDTSSARTLWNERAALELDVAVLSSFDRHSVKIMDAPHTMHAFQRFEAQERKVGREFYARWIWIFSYLTRSTGAEIHPSRWNADTVKPNYSRQPDPWIAWFGEK